MLLYAFGLRVLAAIISCQLAAASPLSKPNHVGVDPLLVATVPGQHFENIAIRHNGDVLLTSLSTSTIYLIPKDEPENSVEVATLPDVTALFGIAELEKDIFYVSGAILNGQDVSPGTNTLWEIDLRKLGVISSKYNLRRVRTRKVADLPEAGILNGMSRLAANNKEILLMSDSFLGAITKVNVKTGLYENTIQDPTMTLVPEGIAVGVNGIRMHKNYLYYASTSQQLFARVPVSLGTATAIGPAEVLLDGIFGDDFILSRDGRKAWLTTNTLSSVLEIDIAAKTSRVLSNSTLLTSATSIALGRLGSDRNSLYVSASSSREGGVLGNLVRLDRSGK